MVKNQLQIEDLNQGEGEGGGKNIKLWTKKSGEEFQESKNCEKITLCVGVA